MIKFRKKIQSFTYLSPFQNFQPFEGKIEIRWDPLTNLTSRIVHFPRKKFEREDLELLKKIAPFAKCPFCPENIESMTCKFEPSLFGKERFAYGDITVIPNLLTFDKYCIVAIISKEHFVHITEINEKAYVIQGIRALIEVLKEIVKRDKKVRYMSINCNYMPMSGSSILHPHIQAIAGEVGTNYHRLILEKSASFFRKHGKNYWEILREKESEVCERFIGTIGDTFWYAPFAPKGSIDVGFIFGKSSILELEEDDLKSFDYGFRRVLYYMSSENIQGYNMSIFSSISREDSSFRVNGRILARRFLQPSWASDTNYFSTLHMENPSYFLPEEVAQGIRELWAGNKQ
jgi:galactose-1-phosphate uridylyltransferase